MFSASDTVTGAIKSHVSRTGNLSSFYQFIDPWQFYPGL